MDVSRADFLKGLLAAAALPATAKAATGPTPHPGFHPDATANGAMPWSKAPEDSPGPLRFVVIGDNTGLARPGVFAQALKQISWMKPDFILSVGDLIEGYVDDKQQIASQWDAIEHAVADAGCPFLYAAGNHDYNSPTAVAAWKERRGADYYAFTYKSALFLVLNTEDPPMPMPAKMAEQFYQMVDLMKTDPQKVEAIIAKAQADSAGKAKEDYGKDLEVANISDAQLAWIKETLTKHSDVKWTFVILHKPAWKMATPAFAKIQLMLGTRPYSVFAGHTHYFTHDQLDGRDHINMATTGGIMQRSGSGTMDHAMLVTLEPEGPSYANTRLSGLMDVAGETGQTTRLY
jgi:UDP-2,3-diacylglucosamine pyrophosphatase LpxH